MKKILSILTIVIIVSFGGWFYYYSYLKNEAQNKIGLAFTLLDGNKDRLDAAKLLPNHQGLNQFANALENSRQKYDEAEMAFRNGQYYKAVNSANQSVELGAQLSNELSKNNY